MKSRGQFLTLGEITGPVLDFALVQMNTTALRLLFAGIVIASALFVFLTSAQLPDPVASQFGTGGKVTNHMSRDAYQVFMTGTTLFRSWKRLLPSGLAASRRS